MSKHTPGPLTVKIEDCWPFRIQTFDADGNAVFSRDLPSNSTSHRNAQEAMTGVGVPPEWEAAKHNARAFADEVLRAAAPELLDACIDARRWLAGWASAEPYISLLDAAIAKATGEQP